MEVGRRTLSPVDHLSNMNEKKGGQLEKSLVLNMIERHLSNSLCELLHCENTSKK